MITITVQPTFGDFYQAARYHARMRDLKIVLVLAVLTVAAMMWHRYLFVGLALVYLVLRPLHMRARCRQVWEQTPSAHRGPTTYRLDEIGLHEQGAGHTALTRWDNFLEFRESKDAFLLYLSPHLYVFLPKRFIEPPQQEAIRELLSKHEKAQDGKQAADRLSLEAESRHLN